MSLIKYLHITLFGLFFFLTNPSNLLSQTPISDKIIDFSSVFSDSLKEVIFFLPTLKVEEEKFRIKFNELKKELISLDSINLMSYTFKENPKSKSKGLVIRKDSVNIFWVNQLEVYFNNFSEKEIKRTLKKYNSQFILNKNETIDSLNLFNIDILDSQVCLKSIENHVPYYSVFINEIINPIYSQEEINQKQASDIKILQRKFLIIEEENIKLSDKVNILEKQLNDLEIMLREQYVKRLFNKKVSNSN